MSATIADPSVQAALKGELLGVRAQIESLAREMDDLRKKEAALLLLVGESTTARPIGGDSLRTAVLDYLRREDPEQAGIHYQKITQALLEQSFLINGFDKGNNVRASIGAGRKAASMFQSLGSGRYTWR
jgi:hypothetical protein